MKRTIHITAFTAALVLGCGSESNEASSPGDNPPAGGNQQGDATQTPQASSDALHKAAERGDLDEIKKLLAANADINSQDGKDGETPLLRAITRSQTEAAKLLIESGADVNLGRKRDGQTPLEMAESRERTEIVALLKAKGAK